MPASRTIDVLPGTVGAVAVVLGLLLSCAGEASLVERPWLDPNAAWQRDPVWHDGQAEYAVYDATRTIYDKSRTYQAVMITNTQHMDTGTTTKAADWHGPNAIAVFKHNVREVITTENYDYRYMTTCFIRTGSMQPYKIAMSSQEDCGSTYKQLVMADDGSAMRGRQDSYFPDEGRREVSIDWSSSVVLQDSLTIVLRSFPFDHPPDGPVHLNVVPDLTSNHLTDAQPMPCTLEYLGTENVTVPIGTVRAHHLRLSGPGDSPDVSDYWFASESSSPWLNILVKYRGPAGITYQLRLNRRWAYWQRSKN